MSKIGGSREIDSFFEALRGHLHRGQNLNGEVLDESYANFECGLSSPSIFFLQNLLPHKSGKTLLKRDFVHVLARRYRNRQRHKSLANLSVSTMQPSLTAENLHCMWLRSIMEARKENISRDQNSSIE